MCDSSCGCNCHKISIFNGRITIFNGRIIISKGRTITFY